MKLIFREARTTELTELVNMLANDSLGSQRERFEDPLPDVYLTAFEAISNDPNNQILVADMDGELAGFLQLTFIPGLTYTGRYRAMIEGVRVNETMRGQGVGQALVNEAVRLAREAGCCMVQLTSNKQRDDALRFYTKLGFVSSHEGFKLHLD